MGEKRWSKVWISYYIAFHLQYRLGIQGSLAALIFSVDGKYTLREHL